ncbi:hypothetical protein [Pararhizobium arenae]|uniref:hypothetical protein n=1 Tax=Pararhizobium arenae TaxID=1856850 RepID=UPI00094B5C5A|nr:hypothetical protein [Pararhizobium arenae]
MNWLGTYLYRGWRWLIYGLPGDIRSAAVGAVTGIVFTAMMTALLTPDPVFFSSFANAQGYAQPLEPLNSIVISSGEDVSFEFQPPELKKAYVCEFAQVEAENHRQLMLSYLGRYPTCFAVAQLSASKYRVFITASTVDVRQSDGNYFCKCPTR